jgi:hypothetical protein
MPAYSPAARAFAFVKRLSEVIYFSCAKTICKSRERITMIPVNSSSLRAVGYDGNRLFVQFHTSGTTYTHYNVPYAVFDCLMRAGSKGLFYNTHIRGRYK